MIGHRTTCILWLYLESFYNRGVTPDQARMVIEQIPDPGSASGLKLRCESARLNSNLLVWTQSVDPGDHADIVRQVEVGLEQIVAGIRRSGAVARRST